MRSRSMALLGLGLALAGAGVAALAVTGTVSAESLHELYTLLSEPTHLRSVLRSYGAWTPLWFTLIQMLQVIISPIPGEATGLLGGYLFGVGWGLFYSTIGLALGSLVAFGIARWLEVSFLERFVKMERLQHLAFITKPEGVFVTFLLFLIPGFPKDLLSYLLGLTPMNVWTFLVVSTIGRIPGTWLLSAQGAQVADQNYRLLVFLLLFALVIAFPLYLYRERILHRVSRRSD